jgi:hypothetical protein
MSNKIIATFILSIVLAVIISQSSATEYPSPPTVPSKFESADDVQRYLNQLHNYYLVVGRPRFGKRNFEFSSFKNAEANRNVPNKKIESSHLFSLMDLNGRCCFNSKKKIILI